MTKKVNGACQSAASISIELLNVNKISTAADTLQAAALDFANSGLPVFPCAPKGKRPLTQNGFKEATTHKDIVSKWWNRWPSANIGLPTGMSTFWALDIDGEEGENSLKRLENQYGELRQNIEVITGGGGRHIYFSPEFRISNSVRKLGPGLDVRGDGGYVIAPPSIHDSGKRYEWSVDSTDSMRPAPTWLINILERDHRSANNEVFRQFIQKAPQGVRNNTLAHIAGVLLRKGVDPILSLELCLCWNSQNCSPPLSQEEAAKVVNSIAKRELQRRRSLK